MGLARAAAARTLAARTLADWAEPPKTQEKTQEGQQEEPQFTQSAEPPPTPAAEPPPTPAAEPHINSAPAPRLSASSQAARPATSSVKPTDPAVLFTRLAAVVRDCIALEARLAASAAGTLRSPTRNPDPRRAKLHEAFRLVTANHPDRAALLRETTARADEHLAADPDQIIEIPNILFAICDELAIEMDFPKLPDEFLFTTDDPPDYDDAFDAAGNETPDPRATSPP